MSTVASNAPAADFAHESWRRVAVGGLLIVAALTVLFWQFFSRQVRWALAEQADWGHTLVIPFIAGYLVYLNREKLLAVPFRTNWMGLLLIIGGVAWYMMCCVGPLALRHHNLMGAGVAFTLLGLVWLFTGTRATVLLLFPLAYLVIFGQSISDRFMNFITFKLQDITAIGSFVLMKVIGFDIERKGNTLYLMHQGVQKPLNIAEACSGMRMLMAFLALGVAMAYTGLKFMWQRIALVLLALPTSIFVNVLRVCTLGLLSLINSDFVSGDFHTFVGLVWLLPAFLLYLGFMWILRRMVVEAKQKKSSQSPVIVSQRGSDVRLFDKHSRWALLVTLLTLGASGIGFTVGVQRLSVYLKKQRVDMRSSFSTIPAQLGPWRMVSDGEKLDAAMIEELGTSLYLNRIYAREINGQLIGIGLHLTYYTDMLDAVPHVPDRCFLAGGLVPLELPRHDVLDVDNSNWVEDPDHVHHTGQRYRMARVTDPFTGLPTTIVRLPVGQLDWRTIVFQNPDEPQSRVFGGYMFVANGAATARTERIRALAFELDQKYAYYSKIQMSWKGPENATAEQYLAYVANLLQYLLPEYMKCLPDWAEVDQRSKREPASK